MHVHGEVIRAYGGSDGTRDSGLIESAVAQGLNSYLYADADVFGVAAAYAYHLAESQAFLDGNKRTGAAAALAFLDINGVDIGKIGSHEVYEMMIHLATKQFTKSSLADFLRDRFTQT
jgi:death-on-curing protein